MSTGPDSTTALHGLRVIDAATLFAGPLAATMLGDFGAEVIKVEHPKGDPVRTHGYQKNGVPLWWKMIASVAHEYAVQERTTYDNWSDEDIAAIEKGIAQLKRGEGRRQEDVMARIKAKHGW